MFVINTDLNRGFQTSFSFPILFIIHCILSLIFLLEEGKSLIMTLFNIVKNKKNSRKLVTYTGVKLVGVT